MVEIQALYVSINPLAGSRQCPNTPLWPTRGCQPDRILALGRRLEPRTRNCDAGGRCGCGGSGATHPAAPL